MSESFLDGRVTLPRGDCLAALRELPSDSIDSCVTDPPYLLKFMSRAWDESRSAQIDPDFAHWFAGFVDGEGCFSVHKKQVNGCETFDCQFSMTLRDDDASIIETIKEKLGGLGSIARRPKTKDDNNSQPQIRYCISSKSDCERLREILTVFPLR